MRGSALAVPEPSIWEMLPVGLGGLGRANSGRKTAAAAA
jgi:hypothetical protein